VVYLVVDLARRVIAKKQFAEFAAQAPCRVLDDHEPVCHLSSATAN
jgi:hypothetical protein